MALLPTIIRERQLGIALRQQALAQLLREMDEIEQGLVIRREELAQLLAGLLQRSAAGQELDVQQMLHARAHSQSLRIRLAALEQEQCAQQSRLRTLEDEIRGAQLELEKLNAILDERRRMDQEKWQQQQWQLLDEWVITQGKRA